VPPRWRFKDSAARLTQMVIFSRTWCLISAIWVLPQMSSSPVAGCRWGSIGADVRTPRRNCRQSRIGHSWLHAWPARASTITRRPQVLRLSPDDARTYFYISENEESAKQARASWHASRPYVVRLRILQGDAYIIPCWQATSVPAGKRRKLKRLLEKNVKAR
jgi:hypothetical protein